nr:MAG TPA: hypothetical protein [Caudoviricetes sp.]
MGAKYYAKYFDMRKILPTFAPVLNKYRSKGKHFVLLKQ